jgi:hypothetical protein
VTVTQVGAGATETPRLEVLPGALMQDAEHGLQESLASHCRPEHCGASHHETSGGEGLDEHRDASTTMDMPVREEDATHATSRVL